MNHDCHDYIGKIWNKFENVHESYFIEKNIYLVKNYYTA